MIKANYHPTNFNSKLKSTIWNDEVNLYKKTEDTLFHITLPTSMEQKKF